MSELALYENFTLGKDTSQTLAILDQVADSSVGYLYQSAMIRRMMHCSIMTGQFVELLPEYNCLPALIGSDSNPVFLYQFVEVLDEILDYDFLQKEFPTLSYSQIAGAISFIRKLSQQHLGSDDIDDLEEQINAEDPELLAAITEAFNDREIVRVLSEPQ